MPATQTGIGYGTTLSYATITGGTPGSYTPIAEVFDSNSPKATVNKSEATNYGSPNATEEYLAGLIALGTATLKINFVGANAATVYGLLRLNRSWKITLPDGSTIVFAGFLCEFGVAIPIKERITVDVSVQATGPITITAGSGFVNS